MRVEVGKVYSVDSVHASLVRVDEIAGAAVKGTNLETGEPVTLSVWRLGAEHRIVQDLETDQEFYVPVTSRVFRVTPDGRTVPLVAKPVVS